MLVQYLLTGVAGVMLGIVAMRIWQARPAAGQDGEAPAPGNTAMNEASSSSSALPSLQSVPPARLMLLGAIAIAAMAAAVMVLRPASDGEAPAALVPVPSTAGNGKAQSLDDVDTMIQRLEKKLQANPQDGDGFRMLGWSYAMTGHPEKAIAPYKRALALLPGNALVHAGYAEALTGVAGGTISKQAKDEFEKARALDPAEPRTRYFLALWKAQNGQGKQAIEEWLSLANSAPVDAPWQSDVRRRITEYSNKLGVDIAGRLKQATAAPQAAAGTEPPPLDPASMQAASRLPADQQQAMVSGMVEGLAAKLRSDPRNAAGWARLLRSRMVLGQGEQAARDLDAARKALADDQAALSVINGAAAQAEVPGA